MALVAANPDLLERELIKLAALAEALADALRRRGVPDPAAAVAAESGVAILRVAMTRWTEDAAGQPWAVHVHDVAAELRRLAV
jgi:hypothetical protein